MSTLQRMCVLNYRRLRIFNMQIDNEIRMRVVIPSNHFHASQLQGPADFGGQRSEKLKINQLR